MACLPIVREYLVTSIHAYIYMARSMAINSGLSFSVHDLQYTVFHLPQLSLFQSIPPRRLSF